MTLVAHYPLQEDSGSTARDHSGRGYEGTINGATLDQTGILGGSSYSFDSSNTQDVSTQFDSSPLGSNSFSTSLWVYPTTIQDQSFHGTLNVGNGTGWKLGMRSAGEVRFTKQGVGNFDTANTYITSTGVWYHIAAVVLSNDDIEIYVDGELKETLSSSSGVTHSSQHEIANDGDNNEHHDGRLADIRIYDRVLPTNEIQYLYNVTDQTYFVTERKTNDDLLSPEIRATTTLDGESATLYVIGSPFSDAREVQEITLQDGTNTYTPTWANSHQEFQMKVQTSKSAVTSRVEVSSLQLRSDLTSDTTTLSWTSEDDFDGEQT